MFLYRDSIKQQWGRHSRRQCSGQTKREEEHNAEDPLYSLICISSIYGHVMTDSDKDDHDEKTVLVDGLERPGVAKSHKRPHSLSSCLDKYKIQMFLSL